jgi:O-antigen ligase
MVRQQPVFGYGTGNVLEASRLVLSGTAVSADMILVSTTDSQVLDILLEGGIVKLSLWIATLWLMWRKAAAWPSRHRHTVHASLLALLTAGLIGGPSFTSPYSSLFMWLFFAISYAEVYCRE